MQDSPFAAHESQAQTEQQWAQHYGHLASSGRGAAADAAELVCVPRALLTRYQELEWEDWRRRYAAWHAACQAYYATPQQPAS